MARIRTARRLRLLALAGLAALVAIGVGNALLPVTAGAASPRAHPAQGPTELGSEIITDTVWTAANSPYIASTGTVTVKEGITLTIEPGVQVQFAESAALRVNGTVIANGDQPSSVEFTSNKPQRAPGDWPGIIVEQKGSLHLRGVTIRYAGKGSASPIRAMSNQVSLENVLIEDAAATGLILDLGATLQGVVIQRIQGAGIRLGTSSGVVRSLSLSNVTINDCTEEAIAAPVDVQWTLSDNHARGNKYNGILLNGGTVNRAVLWPGGDLPYVLTGRVYVGSTSSPTGTLTLAPNTVVKATSGGGFTVAGAGGLRAVGTPSGKILFTALADDDACSRPGEDFCDTNNDGRTTAPTRGAWGGIALEKPTGTGNSELRYAEVRYSNGPALRVFVPNFVIADMRFVDTLREAVKFEGVSGSILRTEFVGSRNPAYPTAPAAAVIIDPQSAGVQGVTVELTGNTFRDNDIAVLMSYPNVQLVHSGNTAVDNGINGLLFKAGTLPVDRTWHAGDLPYVLDGAVTVLETGATLTLEPGLLLKMDPDAKIAVERGELKAGAAGGAMVLITSLRDDACSATQDSGCDTNGNGNLDAPTAGSWYGLTVSRNAGDIELRNVAVRYGGGDSNRTQVELQHAAIVEGCEIAYSLGSGLTVSRAGTALLVGNNIHHNGKHGLVLEAKDTPTVVTLRRNTITNNLGRAIDTDANVELIIEGDENDLRDNAFNGIVVSGTSSLTHTWRNARNIPYLVLGVVRVTKAPLTIAPGAIIKFGNDMSLRGKLEVADGANLIAKGTADAPIIFTSINDDRLNDSNPGAGDVQPGPGDWMGVEIDVTANSDDPDRPRLTELSDIEIHYAGGSGVPAVLIEDSSTRVARAKITNGGGSGVKLQNANASVTDTTISDMGKHCVEMDTDTVMEPTLTGNIFRRCIDAVLTDVNVQPILQGNLAEDNQLNGIVIDGGSTRASRTWPANDLPFILGQRVTVGGGTMLSIEAGALIKALAGTGIAIDGALQVPKPNSGDARVTFTSINDDTCGAAGGTCDTNNNMTLTVPLPGDWDGIEVRNTAAPSMSLKQARVDYAGRVSGAVHIQKDGVATIENCEIDRSGTVGVRLTNAGASILSSMFRGNVQAGIQLEGTAGGTIEGNVFTENGRPIIHRGTSNTTIRNNVSIGNDADAMLYCAPITASQTWQRDMPREIDCVVRMSGGTLTLDPGLAVLFRDRQELFVEGGSLRAEGVVFTAASENPKPDSWRGISIGQNVTTASYVRNSWLLYGGRETDGILDLQAKGRVDIANNMFIGINAVAISAKARVPLMIEGNLFRDFAKTDGSAIRSSDQNTKPEIRYNRFASIPNGVLAASGSQPVIAFNNFAGSQFGIKNSERSVCVDGKENWWGDASGPTDISATRDACGLEVNPNGTGSGVSDNVSWLNYLTTAPPKAPLLDAPRCGVTNSGRAVATGTASPGARVNVYDLLAQQPNDPIAYAITEADGRFRIDLDLARGEHRVFFKSVDGQRQSAGTGYRVITVQDQLPVDPMGLRFEYSVAGGTWVQPVRDDAGCAVACGGPSSGRVTLPADVPVRVRLPITGSPASVSFVQEGQPAQPMTYDGAALAYSTGAFVPVQGGFTIEVAGTPVTKCMGFIYRGGLGVVYNDLGATGTAVLPDGRPFQFDFENDAQRVGWVNDAPWEVTTERARSGTHAWSDSPNGPYRPGVVDQGLIAPGPINLRTLDSPQLMFSHLHALGPRDTARVQIRVGRSGNWQLLKEYQGSNSQSLEPQVISLDKYATEPAVWIRWLLNSDSGTGSAEGDGWYIDDVSITAGGAFNKRYDRGEPTVAGAEVTLERRDPDSGQWSQWDGTAFNQRNPQVTDDNGQYGFYYLEAGIYRIAVNKRGAGIYASPSLAVWNGTFVHDAPLVGSYPSYLPITLRKARLTRR